MSKKSSWEFVGELSNTIVESRDTRKRGSERVQKIKARWGSFLVRPFPPLSHVYLVRYSSKRPVMQARLRLRGGRGGGSTLLFMLSQLSVCSIKGAVSRNSAKLGDYKMPFKLRET